MHSSVRTANMSRIIRPAVRIRRSRRRLTEEQEVHIQSVMRATLPADDGPWTREKAHVLTNSVARTGLPERTFSAYLERWGFVPIKPLRKAHRTDPFGMKAWMAQDYPVIAFQAKEAGAEILWLGLDMLPVLRTGNGIIIEHEGRPIGEHLLHVSTNRGDRAWMVLECVPTAEHIINFLQRLMHDERAIELIVPDITPFKEPNAQHWMVLIGERLNLHALPVTRRAASVPY